MDDLYAVGWRTPGLSRQRVVAVYPSVTAAVAADGGYARFDGGGRWRVLHDPGRPGPGWWPKASRPAADAGGLDASPAVEHQQLAQGIVVGDVGRPAVGGRASAAPGRGSFPSRTPDRVP